MVNKGKNNIFICDRASQLTLDMSSKLSIMKNVRVEHR